MTEGPGASRREEFRIDGSDLMDRARQLVDEGNKRRLVVRNEGGKDVFDIPLTVAVVGGILVFPAAAVGVIAALATRHSIVVESVAGANEPPDSAPGSGAPPPGPWSTDAVTPSGSPQSSPPEPGDGPPIQDG